MSMSRRGFLGAVLGVAAAATAAAVAPEYARKFVRMMAGGDIQPLDGTTPSYWWEPVNVSLLHQAAVQLGFFALMGYTVGDPQLPEGGG